MVVRKKKKFRKFRGKRSYGYGSHKKHRGGGSRGGRGKAGLHKHKWSYIVKYEPDYFGKHGFKRPVAVAKKVKTINLRRLESLAAGKKKIVLAELGYNKVLGSGKIKAGLEVVAEAFSKKAIEKIKAAGGKVVISKKPEKEQEKEKVEKQAEKPKEGKKED